MKNNNSYLLLGAGRMAKGIAYYLLSNDKEAKIILVDKEEKNIRNFLHLFPAKSERNRITPLVSDIENIKTITGLTGKSRILINATHYKYNYLLSNLAIKCHCHMVDLGGNPEMVSKQFTLNEKAKRAGISIVPDTGLAPGMTNILTFAALERLKGVESVKIRVGGLPVKPEEPLNYMLVFSPEGLINEYVEDAFVIKDGKICKVESLSNIETILFRGFGKMEAFNTSGGSSTLVETLKGKVRNLDYKTIRYPGHCLIMRGMKQVGLMSNEPVVDNKISPRAILGQLFEKYIPFKGEDVVLVKIIAEGKSGNRKVRRVVTLVDRMDARTGLSAMTRCTAFPAASIAFMITTGQITRRGVLKQEEVVPVRKFIKMMRNAGLEITIRNYA